MANGDGRHKKTFSVGRGAKPIRGGCGWCQVLYPLNFLQIASKWIIYSSISRKWPRVHTAHGMMGLIFIGHVAKFPANIIFKRNNLKSLWMREVLASQICNSFAIITESASGQALHWPGQHVGQELEAELDVVELLLEAGESLLDHVLPAVHVRHNLVHGILGLKCIMNKRWSENCA